MVKNADLTLFQAILPTFQVQILSKQYLKQLVVRLRSAAALRTTLIF